MLRHSTLPTVAAAMLLSAACDTNGRFNVKIVRFERPMAVSIVPATLEDGQWRRECGGAPADGLLADVALLSYGNVLAPDDKDRSIRPGDFINNVYVDGSRSRDIHLGGTDNLTVELSCLGSAGAEACDGGALPASQRDLAYRALSSERPTDQNGLGQDVLFVLDMSGSNQGLVHPDTLQELPATYTTLPTGFVPKPSDPLHLRMAALQGLMHELNPWDRHAILAFREGLGGGGLSVPCALPEVAGEGWETKLAECFGLPTNEPWYAGLTALRSAGDFGRANLWEAVLAGYEFMAGRPGSQRTRHLVVISDGPDTCSCREHLTDCVPGCGTTTGVQDVIERLQTDRLDPNAPRVQVHFVEFDAPGYPGPDGAQMEVACRSDGVYRFVARDDFAQGSAGRFKQALDDALLAVRYSLMGTWRVALEVPALASDAARPAGVPRGQLYSLAGAVNVAAESQLLTDDDAWFFTGGTLVGDDGGLLTFRKACRGAVDCGASGDADETCQIICSEDSLTCPGGAEGVRAPNGSACADGSDGICCEGQCLPAPESCSACEG